MQGRVSTGMVAQATLPATVGNKLEDKYQRNLDRYIVYHNYTCSESKVMLGCLCVCMRVCVCVCMYLCVMLLYAYII